MSTKSLFILITLILTVIVTIFIAIDSMNSWAYIIGGKINNMVWITPCIGLVLCMFFYMMPDKNENNK